MRYLAAVLAVLLLCCAPVSAQPSTPVPSVGTTAISEFKDASQAFGVLNVAMFALLVGVVVLVVLAVRYIVLPLITANSQANQLITANQVQVTNALLEGVKAQQVIATTNERSLEVMAGMETKAEAGTRTDNAVTNINDHTDEGFRIQLEDIRQLIHDAFKSVSQAQFRNEQRQSEEHETADLTLAKAATNLIEAEKQVKKLHDTGKLTMPTAPTNDKHPPEE